MGKTSERDRVTKYMVVIVESAPGKRFWWPRSKLPGMLHGVDQDEGGPLRRFSGESRTLEKVGPRRKKAGRFG